MDCCTGTFGNSKRFGRSSKIALNPCQHMLCFCGYQLVSFSDGNRVRHIFKVWQINFIKV